MGISGWEITFLEEGENRPTCRNPLVTGGCLNPSAEVLPTEHETQPDLPLITKSEWIGQLRPIWSDWLRGVIVP